MRGLPWLWVDKLEGFTFLRRLFLCWLTFRGALCLGLFFLLLKGGCFRRDFNGCVFSRAFLDTLWGLFFADVVRINNDLIRIFLNMLAESPQFGNLVKKFHISDSGRKSPLEREL